MYFWLLWVSRFHTSPAPITSSRYNRVWVQISVLCWHWPEVKQATQYPGLSALWALQLPFPSRWILSLLLKLGQFFPLSLCAPGILSWGSCEPADLTWGCLEELFLQACCAVVSHGAGSLLHEALAQLGKIWTAVISQAGQLTAVVLRQLNGKLCKQ